jgi:hypothetical protein
MLLTDKATVKWAAPTKAYYESLGYTYTKLGDEFEVSVEHLPKASRTIVKYRCDGEGCGIEKDVAFAQYNKMKGKRDLCSVCYNKVSAVDKHKRMIEGEQRRSKLTHMRKELYRRGQY